MKNHDAQDLSNNLCTYEKGKWNLWQEGVNENTKTSAAAQWRTEQPRFGNRGWDLASRRQQTVKLRGGKHLKEEALRWRHTQRERKNQQYVPKSEFQVIYQPQAKPVSDSGAS